jgi:transposase
MSGPTVYGPVVQCTTEEQRSVVRFLRAKGPSAKVIHKEIFPVYGGKCFSRKAVQNWVHKFAQGRSKVTDDARRGRPVQIAKETTVQLVEKFIRAKKRITSLRVEAIHPSKADGRLPNYTALQPRWLFSSLLSPLCAVSEQGAHCVYNQNKMCRLIKYVGSRLKIL